MSAQTFILTFLYPDKNNIVSLPIRGVSRDTSIDDIFVFIDETYKLQGKFHLVRTCGGTSAEEVMNRDANIGRYLGELPYLYVVKKYQDTAESSNAQSVVQNESSTTQVDAPAEVQSLMADADQEQMRSEKAAADQVQTLIRKRQLDMRQALPSLTKGILMLTRDVNNVNGRIIIDTDKFTAEKIKNLPADDERYTEQDNVRFFIMKLDNKLTQVVFHFASNQLAQTNMFIFEDKDSKEKNADNKPVMYWSSFNQAEKRNIQVLVAKCILFAQNNKLL